MAPELLVKGEQPSAMSDVYALGMVFLEVRSRNYTLLIASSDTNEFFFCSFLRSPSHLQSISVLRKLLCMFMVVADRVAQLLM